MPLRRGGRLAALVAVVVILAGAAVGIWNVQRLSSARERVARADELQTELAALERRLLDAETGQRGFLISGDEGYLSPYRTAVGQIVPTLDRVDTLSAGSSTAARVLPTLRRLVDTKLDELARTIAVRRERGFDAARALVLTNLGRTTMDEIRGHVESLGAAQRAVVSAEAAASAVSVRTAMLYSAGAGAVGVLLVAIGLWAFERVLDAQEISEGDARELVEATAAAAIARTRLNEVVANVPSVVWEAWGQPDAAAQRIDFVSDYVTTMLGYDPDDWLEKPNFWLTIVHPDDRERAASEALAKFTGGGSGRSEFRWMTKDGRAIWVEARSQTILDEQGRPVGMRGVTSDITAQKELDAGRAALLAREQELNRLKDEFLATLSHELRTPMNAVLGWLQMLRSGAVAPERVPQALEAVERNAAMQNRLIEDLLDVSRIVTGKLHLDVQDVDLRDVLDAALASVHPAAEAKALHVETSVDPELGPIRADASRLQQVLWNLLANAVKFTPAGGHIRADIRRAGANVEIVVGDDGEGIPPGVLPHIFERFRQGDGGSTRAASGLGLGLAIVRHIVELHGGTVAAGSAGSGGGATFTVTMPLRETAAI